MWFFKLIGWSLLGVVACIAIFVFIIIEDESRSGQLQVQIKPDPLFGAIPTLAVKNIGKDPIELKEVTANNRPECKPEFVPPINNALILKVGESAVAASKCEIVRTKIKTNKGEFEFTFRGR